MQLLQNYSQDTAEFLELQQLEVHPLVDLLLNNLTLTYVGLDEHTNYALRKFVELRLNFNKECFLEVLQKFAGSQLEQEEQEEL